jgi:hypothetical protein
MNNPLLQIFGKYATGKANHSPKPLKEIKTIKSAVDKNLESNRYTRI